MNSVMPCPVCGGEGEWLDVVDFNKSCEERRGRYTCLSGRAVYYAICDDCDFVFSPEFFKWKKIDFSKYIYNKDYIKIDPDYIKERPENNAKLLLRLFKNDYSIIKHLDYGSGSGLLSGILSDKGWRSMSYDPFMRSLFNSNDKYQLITAFEVFEHVSDVNELMSNLSSILDDNGLIIVSTLFSDGKISRNSRLSWWYASPRNGHISLFSKTSMSILARKFGFRLRSVSDGLHFLARGKPPHWVSNSIGNI